MSRTQDNKWWHTRALIKPIWWTTLNSTPDPRGAYLYYYYYYQEPKINNEACARRHVAHLTTARQAKPCGLKSKRAPRRCAPDPRFLPGDRGMYPFLSPTGMRPTSAFSPAPDWVVFPCNEASAGSAQLLNIPTLTASSHPTPHHPRHCANGAGNAS